MSDMESLQLNYETITTKPISGALGVVIEGIDLANISRDIFDEIRHAFTNYQVILFRDQDLTLEEYIDFSQRFGTLIRFPSSVSTSDHLEVIQVDKHNDNDLAPYVIWNQWYSDQSYLREPGAGSIAYCQSCDGFGGDTLFASQSMAYNSLSLTTQAMLNNLKGVHQYIRQKSSERRGQDQCEELPKVSVQPVVRTLDDTGVKNLYVNPTFTREISGMTNAESQMLLRFLFDHTTQEAFTCRITWEQGTIAIWDNRCVLHYDLANFKDKNRVMYKSGVKGVKPY